MRSMWVRCHSTKSSEETYKKKHEGVRYPCDKCDYAATLASNLKRHIENKHKWVRYPCDQCEYVATGVQSLKIHIESKHEGVRYPCDQCDHSATTARNILNLNIKE